MSNRIKALKRINIDIKAINEAPIEGIGIASIGEDLMRYVINMRLMNGPYEGYCVQLLLIFTDNYPVKPPKILIYPNQAINGEYHHHIFDNNSHDEYNNFKKYHLLLLVHLIFKKIVCTGTLGTRPLGTCVQGRPGDGTLRGRFFILILIFAFFI